MINIKIGHPQTQVELKARKTLDGNLLILDHDMIDIALIPLENKVMSFPKTTAAEDSYGAQARLFEFLANNGIIIRESIQGGNIFNSLEAIVPETPQLNSMQAAVYVISHFLITEKEARQTAADYEDNLEKYFLKPSDQDSTEWGEVPQQAEKGAMVPGYYYIPLRYRY
mgnify:CR=1 FL=1|tara:strand:+ start:9067 stop:9573 length:507 start_codon:yes stop_codon:yes gene_type:complete